MIPLIAPRASGSRPASSCPRTRKALTAWLTGRNGPSAAGGDDAQSVRSGAERPAGRRAVVMPPIITGSAPGPEDRPSRGTPGGGDRHERLGRHDGLDVGDLEPG